MKIGKFFSYIFAALGIVLTVFSLGFCLLSLKAPVRMLQLPAGAEQCAQDFCQAVDRGDLARLEELLYGGADLGAEAVPGTPESALVREAFLESLSCEFYGNYYPSDSGIARDVKITALDLDKLLGSLSEHAGTVLSEKIAAAESLEDIYDENNNYREDLVEQVLAQALQRALAQNSTTVTREVTLKLVCRDGAWWVVPEQALLQALAGAA